MAILVPVNKLFLGEKSVEEKWTFYCKTSVVGGSKHRLVAAISFPFLSFSFLKATCDLLDGCNLECLFQNDGFCC